MSNVTKLVVRLAPDAPPITLNGRGAWAVYHLHKAGETGCTPITTPGPRWSDYTFKAKKAGLQVETITETHRGTYAGHHARYVLRSVLEILQIETAEAA
jgi:hypothetical protein